MTTEVTKDGYTLKETANLCKDIEKIETNIKKIGLSFFKDLVRGSKIDEKIININELENGRAIIYFDLEKNQNQVEKYYKSSDGFKIYIGIEKEGELKNHGLLTDYVLCWGENWLHILNVVITWWESIEELIKANPLASFLYYDELDEHVIELEKTFNKSKKEVLKNA